MYMYLTIIFIYLFIYLFILETRITQWGGSYRWCAQFPNSCSRPSSNSARPGWNGNRNERSVSKSKQKLGLFISLGPARQVQDKSYFLGLMRYCTVESIIKICCRMSCDCCRKSCDWHCTCPLYCIIMDSFMRQYGCYLYTCLPVL